MNRPKMMVSIFIASLLCTSYLFLDAPSSVQAVYRPVRSVLVCDRQSEVPANSFMEPDGCRRHCDKTYINVNNRHLWYAHLKHQQPHHHPQQPYIEQEPECCCLFEAPWPDLVNPAAFGRQKDHETVNSKRVKKERRCYPLIGGRVLLNSHANAHYQTLCKYLSKKNPLTMLEMMQFAEAVAFLQYLGPKHPSAMATLSFKNVKQIKNVEKTEIHNALYDFLLDDTFKWRWSEFPGYRLEPRRAKKLLEARNLLSNALKSKIFARAFDELVLSQVLMDVMAAFIRVNELNRHAFKLPERLLQNNYDQYDKNLASEFTLTHVDCPLLAQMSQHVEMYLDSTKSLLSLLDEKGTYEHMGQKFPPAVNLINSQKIYEKIHKVNCRSRYEDG